MKVTITKETCKKVATIQLPADIKLEQQGSRIYPKIALTLQHFFNQEAILGELQECLANYIWFVSDEPYICVTPSNEEGDPEVYVKLIDEHKNIYAFYTKQQEVVEVKDVFDGMAKIIDIFKQEK